MICNRERILNEIDYSKFWLCLDCFDEMRCTRAFEKWWWRACHNNAICPSVPVVCQIEFKIHFHFVNTNHRNESFSLWYRRGERRREDNDDATRLPFLINLNMKWLNFSRAGEGKSGVRQCDKTDNCFELFLFFMSRDFNISSMRRSEKSNWVRCRFELRRLSHSDDVSVDNVSNCNRELPSPRRHWKMP